MQNKLGEDLDLDQRDKQQLVEELQLARRSAVQSLRNVVNTPVGVTVRPADSVLRDRIVATGTTRELQSRSVVAVVGSPVAIGSFYALQWDASSLDLPAAFGRCDQITMQAEDRFEVRFQFLQPLSLPEDSVGRPD